MTTATLYDQLAKLQKLNVGRTVLTDGPEALPTGLPDDPELNSQQ